MSTNTTSTSSDDATGQGSGDADDERTRAAGGAGADGGAGDQGSGGTASTSTDDDEANRIAKLSRESASYRRQLREEQEARAKLEERLAKLEKPTNDGDDAEAQAKREREEREREEHDAKAAQRVRRISLRAEVAAQAGQLNLADVDATLAILRERPEFRDIEWSDDEPTADSVKEALAALLEDKPFLVKQPERQPGEARSGSGGATGGGTGGKPPKETDEQRRARLRGEGSAASMWDPDEAARRGGGVV